LLLLTDIIVVIDRYHCCYWQISLLLLTYIIVIYVYDFYIGFWEYSNTVIFFVLFSFNTNKQTQEKINIINIISIALADVY
jgi:ABC-type protease/lipase transport system fused ATPase/permease subunit